MLLKFALVVANAGSIDWPILVLLVAYVKLDEAKSDLLIAEVLVDVVELRYREGELDELRM